MQAASPAFQDLLRRLLNAPLERQAIESGQVDAILDPATGASILLPAAQEAMRESQLHAHSLVKLSSDWQWEHDKDFRFTSCEGSRIVSSAFGDKTIVGKRLWDLPFDNMTELDWQVHRSEVQHHAVYRNLELRSRDHAGAVCFFSVSGEPVFDKRGKFKGYRGTAREISNLTLAEGGSHPSYGILLGALDALLAQICVLDSSGTIIYSNAAWRAFAATLGCPGIGLAEGASYLAVCDNAGADDRVNGSAMAAGIRQVIAGQRRLFRYEYGCNRPTGRCGFMLTARPFAGDGPARVVISHEEATMRERADQSLHIDDLVAKRAPIANRVLAAMPLEEYRCLSDGLEPVFLNFGDVLYEPGDPIRYVYFPGDSLVSLLTQVEERMTLEVGLIGSEGMVGISLALGVSSSPMRALVQGTGAAMRMEAGRFQLELKQSPSLQRELYRYSHLLMAQFTQTAACNRFHGVEARLARWLSMTRDRVSSDRFHLTHDFMADMLGVRRVGITNAATTLRERRLIEYNRGDITILDRKGLNAAACVCYRVVKNLFDGLRR
jgi:CRP-like cAMP-binding protein/PAS domain-containing protein